MLNPIRFPLRSNLNCAAGQYGLRRYICQSGVTRQTKALSCDDKENYRKSIAPWLKFGEFERGLLSHLSTYEIVRALLVLNICSIDTVVDKSAQLLQTSKKLGKGAEFVVRKTFYDQFVGGEEITRMGEVVNLLHLRGLTLMVVPVEEEDVEDEKAPMQVYNQNLLSIKAILEMVSKMETNKAMFQLKLSALIPAKTLERINEAFKGKWKKRSDLAKLVDEVASKKVEDWSFLSGVEKEDREHYVNGLVRADEFVKLAYQLGVKVLADAEFNSCKYAISTTMLALMARYNTGEYVIGDTIQGYHKDAYEKLSMELEVTKLLGSSWYGKIVRGAYMDRERYLAKKAGKPCIVWDTYEETSNSYNRCVDTALRHVVEASGSTSHLVIATHNEKSIRLAVQNMTELGIKPMNNVASFAQIYGMADYLSSPLVKLGYKVYKSTPYGPLNHVLPYLARRASENRSVLKGAREERTMLKKELLSRIF